MKLFLPCLLFLLSVAAAPLRSAPVPDRTSLIVATGASGEMQYSDLFATWTANWEKAGEAGGAQIVSIKASDKEAKEHLRQAVETEPKEGTGTVWLVLLGHGSFDGKDGKFNLAGDDVTAAELATWLKPFQRPVVVVCGFSASGVFLKPLSAPGRVVVTATRSGAENNYARLAGYLSETVGDSKSDLDKDGQTSLLEAWLAASQRTASFYKDEGRLATEHSLLDDNGDEFGTPADWFQGIRVVKKSSDHRLPDGLRAHQIHLLPSAAEKTWPPALREERDQLERDLAKLREAKASIPEEEYYKQIESLLLKLAKVYRDADQAKPQAPAVEKN